MTTHRAYAALKPVTIQRHLSLIRKALVKDLGGTEDSLSAQQIIIIDGIIARLGIVRSMEEYIKATSIMKGQELSPCLRTEYLAYRNSIDKALSRLGLKRSEIEEIKTIEQVIDAIDKEETQKKQERRKGIKK